MNLVNKCDRCGAVYAGDECPKCAPSVPEAARVEAEEVRRRIGGFEILGPLGEGGMGRIYKARQIALDRIVALKVLAERFANDPEFQNRFEREAKAMAALQHPNIVSVIDFGREPLDPARGGGDTYYFAMELIDGIDLRKRMTESRLPPEESVRIVAQVCDALEYAHDAGVIHRDIKPENVLIDRTGRARIADFGLARLTGPNVTRLTMTDERMGTMNYASPEQMEGTSTVDHRTDLYSLGVMLYELLTGELPLGRFDPPSKRAGTDPRLDGPVFQALEKDRDRRPQSAAAFRELITRKVPTTLEPIPAGKRKSLPLRLAAAMLILAALVAGAFFLLRRTEAPEAAWRARFHRLRSDLRFRGRPPSPEHLEKAKALLSEMPPALREEVSSWFERETEEIPSRPWERSAWRKRREEAARIRAWCGAMIAVTEGLPAPFEALREEWKRRRELFAAVVAFRGTVTLRIFLWPYAEIRSLKSGEAWAVRDGKVQDGVRFDGERLATPAVLENVEIGDFRLVVWHPDFGERALAFPSKGFEDGATLACTGSLAEPKSIRLRVLP